MGSSYTVLIYHIVFSTVGRYPFLTDKIRQAMFECISGILANRKTSLLAGGGIEDHVHLLIKSKPQISLADLVRDVKANSSRWLRESFLENDNFAWQTGYSAFTVSLSECNRVKKYIANQENHHRIQSYSDEMACLQK